MELTKEECIRCLDSLYNNVHKLDESEYKFERYVIKKLIDLLFDNHPLKFEELKEGMWVWDNKENLYGKVTEEDLWKHDVLSIPGRCWGVFEPNRFYRREVVKL